MRAEAGVGVLLGLVETGSGMGDGVDRDIGRDVVAIGSAGDEVLVAVGVGLGVAEGVGLCLVGTWIVEFG